MVNDNEEWKRFRLTHGRGREAADQQFETLLEELILRVPGSELDHARESWREAMKTPEPPHGHVSICLSSSDNAMVLAADTTAINRMVHDLKITEPTGVDRDTMVRATISYASQLIREVTVGSDEIIHNMAPDGHISSEKVNRAVALLRLLQLERATCPEDMEYGPHVMVFAHVLRDMKGGGSLVFSVVQKVQRQ